ncbi:hypothetical protein Tco_1392975 [Tanacetum coccineum]
MSNNNNLQTNTSSALHNPIMEAGDKDIHAIKYKMSKEKKRCMSYFRSLHSHLNVLSNKDLKGTRIEHGFKRAFMSLSGQNDETFTSTIFLNVDQLEKQLDKDKFQEDGSMATFSLSNSSIRSFLWIMTDK